MKDKILAIKGHPTRRNEVIEILEMLGGKNLLGHIGNNPLAIYSIDENNNCIYCHGVNEEDDYIVFILEDFLEKYPFKVGDKVKTIYGKIGNVSKCKWDADNNCMMYKLDTSVYNDSFYFAHELIPYKEEIKAEERLEIYADHAIDNDSKTDVTIDGERLIAPNGYTIGNATRNSNKLIVEYIKNKPQYPETYNECCNVLIINPKSNDAQGYKADDIICFQELLIARDAYWKLAGDWEEKRKKEINHYVIYSTLNGGLVKDCLSCTMVKHLLDFPTEEMRDAFYEIFKDLIESCKEFL